MGGHFSGSSLSNLLRCARKDRNGARKEFARGHTYAPQSDTLDSIRLKSKATLILSLAIVILPIIALPLSGRLETREPPRIGKY